MALLRPVVFHPKIARKNWVYLNMDELAIAEGIAAGQLNPYAEASWMEERLRQEAKARGADYFHGGFMEPRTNLWRDTYLTKENDGQRMRHWGYDLWAPANTVVLAPCEFKVIRTIEDPVNGGWGGCIIGKMEQPHLGADYLIIAHLMPSWLPALKHTFKKGDQVGRLGKAYENGGWAPHVHFQLFDNEYYWQFWPDFELMDGYGPNDEAHNPHIIDPTMLVMEEV